MKATRAYLEALTTGLTKSNVKFNEGKNWQTDIKRKIITYNPQNLIDNDIDLVKGLLIHETGHVNFTTAGIETPEEKKHPSIQQVYNVLEDLRIENEQIKTHGDFAEEPLKIVNATGLLSKAEKPEKLKAIPELMQFLHGLQTHIIPEALDLDYTLGYGEKYNIQSKVKEAIGEKLAKKIQDVLTNSNGTDELVYKIKHCSNTDEIKQLAHEAILPYCQDLLDEADKQPEKLTGLEPVKEYGAGYQLPKLHRSTSIPNASELEALLQPHINTLARKLSDILKEKAQIKYNGNYRRGKLLSKNAYKVLTSDNRIFSKRNNPNNPNYVITMILDESGSMERSTKHTGAFIGSFLLDKTCKKLGFKVNVIGMDNTAQTINDINDYRTIRGGGNDEEQALDYARNMLDKNDDNILFMLTDGLACSNPKQIIEKLTTEYNTKLIAIGIALTEREISEMQRIYPNSVQADKPEELSSVMINAMQRLISR